MGEGRTRLRLELRIRLFERRQARENEGDEDAHFEEDPEPGCKMGWQIWVPVQSLSVELWEGRGCPLYKISNCVASLVFCFLKNLSSATSHTT